VHQLGARHERVRGNNFGTVDLPEDRREKTELLDHQWDIVDENKIADIEAEPPKIGQSHAKLQHC
jgi:hypothetical protein